MTHMSPHGNFPPPANAPGGKRGVPVPMVIAIACTALVCGCLGGGVIGVLLNVGQAVNTLAQNLRPRGAVVAVTTPATVNINEEFQIVVAVTDTSTQPRQIHSVDLKDTLLAGLTIVKIDPPANPAATGVALPGYTSHQARLPIAAGGTSTITITLKATSPGTFEGDIDVYVDTDMTFTTERRSITVTP